MSDKVKESTSPAKGKVRVFVYGTLKADHPNHGLLQAANAEFVGYDSITGAVRMTDMYGFPGVYRPPQSSPDVAEDGTLEPMVVRGEVWAVEPEGLMSLDMLEGHPNFYRREKWWTDKEVRAWIYLMSPSAVVRGLERGWFAKDRSIPEGIWRPTEDEAEAWETAA